MPDQHDPVTAQSGPCDDKQPGPQVYVGPTLGRHGLAQYCVYKGRLPAHVQALAARYPELSRLIVPVAKLSQARADLQCQGHPLQAAAQAVLTAYRQDGRNS